MEEASARKRHILVADDEPHIGRIIKMKLEQGPFEVTLTFDGEEALAALAAQPAIDLMLLDLMMPGMSGLDVLSRVKTDERWSEIPSVILTAAGEEEQHRAAMAAGATFFVTKPFSPKKLYALVAELTGVQPPGAG